MFWSWYLSTLINAHRETPDGRREKERGREWKGRGGNLGRKVPWKKMIRGREEERGMGG